MTDKTWVATLDYFGLENQTAIVTVRVTGLVLLRRIC